MSEVMGNSGVSIANEMLGMHGLALCLGCDEHIVAGRYCAECRRIDGEIERKRLVLVERHNVGVAPFEASEVSPDPDGYHLLTVLIASVGVLGLLAIGLHDVVMETVKYLLAVSR